MTALPLIPIANTRALTTLKLLCGFFLSVLALSFTVFYHATLFVTQVAKPTPAPGIVISFPDDMLPTQALTADQLFWDMSRQTAHIRQIKPLPPLLWEAPRHNKVYDIQATPTAEETKLYLKDLESLIPHLRLHNRSQIYQRQAALGSFIQWGDGMLCLLMLIGLGLSCWLVIQDLMRRHTDVLATFSYIGGTEEKIMRYMVQTILQLLRPTGMWVALLGLGLSYALSFLALDFLDTAEQFMHGSMAIVLLLCVAWALLFVTIRYATLWALRHPQQAGEAP